MSRPESEVVRVELWRLIGRLAKRCGGIIPAFTDVILADDMVLSVTVRRSTKAEVQDVILGQSDD